MKKLLCFVPTLVSVALVAGCASFSNSVLPADFAKNGECVAEQVVAGNTSAVSIEAACLPGQLSTVVDAIEYLIAGDFGKAHPAAASALKANVAAERAVGLAGR